MKITCDFCGSVIDTKNNDKCPECGASYNNDEQYKEHVELDLERQRLANEKEKLKIKRAHASVNRKERERKHKQLQRIILYSCLFLMFGLPFLVGIFLGLYEVFVETTIDFEDVELIEDDDHIKAEGNLHEWVDNGTYAIKVDSIKEINREPYVPSNGYMYIAIHLSLKNTSSVDVQMWEEHVDIIVDEYVQTRTWDINYKEISTDYIRPGMMIDGYEIFEIPKQCSTIVLKYGEYISINIDVSTIEHINN